MIHKTLYFFRVRTSTFLKIIADFFQRRFKFSNKLYFNKDGNIGMVADKYYTGLFTNCINLSAKILFVSNIFYL